MHSFYLKITYTVFIWANISLSSLVNSCSQHILTGNSELMGTGTENINVDLCLLEFSSCTILHKRLIMHGETYLERWTEISDCFHLLYHIPVLNPFSFSCSSLFLGQLATFPLFQFTLQKQCVWLWSASGKHTCPYSALLAFCHLGLIFEPRSLEQEENIDRIIMVLFSVNSQILQILTWN